MKQALSLGGKWFGLVLSLCGMVGVHGQASVNWTSFNDHYAGPLTSPFATAWNLFGTASGAPGSSGPLLDIRTGQELPVVLIISTVGTIGQGGLAGSPAQGTPADQVFRGYIDWSYDNVPAAPQVYPGAQVDYTFVGLDPQQRYSFVGTSVRGGNYPQRWSLIELQDALGATPAHTTGTAIYTGDMPATQVALNSGMNSATGDYVRWDDIVPGPQGSFTIRCTYYSGPIPGGTAGGSYAYALMAIRLQEYNSNPVPASIVAQPADQTVLELTAATFQARAAGVPPPQYQWYRDNALIPFATNDLYRLTSATVADDRAGFHVVASNWVAGVSCTATSRVARLTVLADRTPPTMVSVIPPAEATVSTLTSIEVFFSEPVTGVEPSSLLVAGAGATSLDPITASQYVFHFPQPTTGLVEVAWAPNHRITDLTSSSNRLADGGWTYRLDTNIMYAVRLNEIMAARQRVIRDEDGDYSNWIELHNSGTRTVPLDGCFLTDNDRDLTRWPFPPVSLTPGSYLLIWASGKNRTNSTAPLHTNFKLEKDGSFLALVAPGGQSLISAFAPAYPVQFPDVSYGCDRTVPSMKGYFTTPTPGAANATAGADFGPPVRFSRDSGTFTQPFSLDLSTTSTNAVIRYVLGTNLPTSADTLYTGPIRITNTVQVRARTFVSGLFPGDIHTENYLLLDTSSSRIPGSTNNVANFSSDLPIVVFHNYGKGAVPMSDPGMFAMIQVFEPKNGRSSLTNLPDLAVQGTIHRRGQATRWNAKASLRLETINAYGDDKDVSLLGFPAESDWVLYAINGYDKVLMHNPLAHSLYRQLGRYSSRTRFVEVFLKEDTGVGPVTAAHYNGLYVVEEKIKLGKHRIDIDPLRPENTNAPSITGGYLFSIDKDGPSPGLSAAGSSLWNLDPDGPTLATPQRAPQRRHLTDHLNAFYAALTGPNATNPITGYAAYIDVPAWIDYNLHQVLVFNADMLRISAYYCKPRNEKLTPAALWDFDRAFAMYAADGDQRGFNPWRWHAGTMDRGTDPFNMDGDGGFSNPWYGRLFLDLDFWQRWIDRYQELRDSVYSQSNLTAVIEGFGNEVREATTREYARWAGSGNSDTTPNSGRTTGDGWTYTFPTPGTWAAQVTFIKTWFTNRLTFMDTNFLDKPTVNLPGGLVASGTVVTVRSAAKSGTTLYYTLDGTDPRLPGGGVSPRALSNLGPRVLVITDNVRLCARSWNPNHRNLTGAHNPPLTTPWSGLTVVSYYVALPTLRIAEVMYHPWAAPAGNTNDVDHFEYVELVNVGTNALSLPGFRLGGGLSYTFTANSALTSLAAGGRVLVVKDVVAFASRYPAATNLVAGQFDGQLNNAGDRITLYGPLGEPIHDFKYDDNWWPVTDGLGFSLVAANENAPASSWTNVAQWRPSAYDGGSPGVPGPTPSGLLPVLVNEVLSNPIPPEGDAIELWNPNDVPMNIGYWYLTDNPDLPRKYLIPPDTTLPAFGYRVFEALATFGVAGVTNALGTLNDPFGLSSEGEVVCLFSGDSSGRLTGYFHRLNFGPAAPATSMGRYVNSLSEVSCAAQSEKTLGDTNAYPLVGPVVISEIMYYPPDLVVGGLPTGNARDEYLELSNITSGQVPLYDELNPGNTWHLRDTVWFNFPPGVELPPGGRLLVVSFSPEADPVSLAAFKTRYALTNQVAIYGPFEGRLGNDGGRIDLRRPGVANPTTRVVPMILVDRVDYGVASPWPSTANGTGASLQRKDDAAFGNDPANWVAAGPTPGVGAPLDISREPRSQTVPEESTVTFEVGVVGTGPYLFQWYYGDQPIDGARDRALPLTNVRLSQAGEYWVLVRNGVEEVRSGTARLTVLPLPVIARQPADLDVPAGGEIALSVTAAGTGALRYQWQFNAADLAAATADSLVIHNAQPSHAGAYRVLVSDSVGTRASRAAQVNVLSGTVAMSITLQDAEVLISWPDNAGTWVLEETNALALGPTWTVSTAIPGLRNGRWQATVPLSGTTAKYYRLRKL